MFHQLNRKSKWTALPHIQMISASKHASDNNVFPFLFTRAWKLLPGYILFLLSIHSVQSMYDQTTVNGSCRSKRVAFAASRYKGNGIQ